MSFTTDAQTLTFAEAARATGLTKKALRNRVYRGQLEASLQDGVRHIALAELERTGLLGCGEPDGRAAARPAAGVASPSGASGETARELFDRLERQALELAQLRDEVARLGALAEDRSRLEAELREARARVEELEPGASVAERPRIWKRRHAGDAASAPSARRAPSQRGAAGNGHSLVDLNRAGVDELRALPGVGVKAAERIVEHRDRHGGFHSVRALQTVEGFDPHRVLRIAPHARV